MTTIGEPRISKRELFALLGYSPHEGQLAVHKSRARVRVLACGVRWGKTTAASMEAIAAVLAPCKESRGWIVAPYREMADRTFKRVAETIKRHFPHRIHEYSPREQRLVVVNLSGGLSEVRGKSADNATGLLGESLDWLVLDEAARVPSSIWQSHLSQRLVDRRGWALIISTPRGRDWFYRLYRRGQSGRDPGYESWKSPSTANPHLNAETIAEEQRTLPREVFAQEYLAEFRGAENEPCDVCHGPRSGAVSVIVLHGEEEPLQCPECGGFVHEDGETACGLNDQNQRYPTTLITLEDTPKVVELP